MVKIYTAGPLFNEKEVRRCGIIEKMCETLQVDYFSPRLETSEEGKSLGLYNKMLSELDFTKNTKEEILKQRDIIATKILESNLEGIDSSDILIACIDNRDPGTMFEIGYAIAQNKPVITYSFENFGSNIMISQSTVYHANITEEDASELSNAITELRNYLETVAGYTLKCIREQLYKLKDMELE